MAKGKKEGVNELEAVRQIVKKHGKEVMTADIVKLAKEEHGVDISTDVASNYKSTAIRQLGLGSAWKGKRGRKPGPKPAAAASANVAKAAPRAGGGAEIS